MAKDESERPMMLEDAVSLAELAGEPPPVEVLAHAMKHLDVLRWLRGCAAKIRFSTTAHLTAL